MREIEVWFARHGDRLFYASNFVGNQPRTYHRVREVRWTLQFLKERYEIVSVGIVPPEALGLE